jgi:PAS domain S-box-containing protein
MAQIRVPLCDAVSGPWNRQRSPVSSEADRLFVLSIDMLCIAGFDGYFKKLNPAWSKTLGFSDEELTARPYLDFVHPEDRPATIAEAMKLSQGVDTIHFENRYRCKDGSYKWLAWTAKQSVPEQLIFAIARDMTAQKRSEDEITRLNAALAERLADLEASNKGLEGFSYSVSHDLRAPLRAIDGFVRILVQEYGPKLDPGAQRYLEIIAGSARSMGLLIDDLLEFSRLGRQPLRRVSIDTTALVRRILGQLQSTMDHRSVEVRLNELPDCQGDESLLEHVFANLIGNAIKYTQRVEVARIEIGCQSTDQGEFAYYIKDNGAGFDMRYADKLFGVFQRLHRADEFEGTGVGLALAQRIIHRHGGRIWADATVGKGATFCFTLSGASQRQAMAA